MKKGIVFIVGPSKSGKTYIQNKLIENHSGLYRILSTTTRVPREGEVDGVDYNFLKQDIFDELNKEKAFLQSVSFGGASYGTQKTDYRESGIGLFVCTPEGILDTINALKKHNLGHDFEYAVVYFNVSNKLLNKRGMDDERAKRGDVRLTFNESHIRGDFANIPIMSVHDFEAEDEGLTKRLLDFINRVSG